MNLTEKPVIVTWPLTHYVFIEKIGPFQEIAQSAWETLHKHLLEISKHNKISGKMSLYKIKPTMLYRAGVVVDSTPISLPEGFEYMKFEGGKYSRFVLTGSYSNLPEACGRVFAIVEESKIDLRDDFFIEHYANDSMTTPEDKLVTEILIPTK
jgi:predicted transcriptional regulator YdeE